MAVSYRLNKQMLIFNKTLQGSILPGPCTFCPGSHNSLFLPRKTWLNVLRKSGWTSFKLELLGMFICLEINEHPKHITLNVLKTRGLQSSKDRSNVLEVFRFICRVLLLKASPKYIFLSLSLSLKRFCSGGLLIIRIGFRLISDCFMVLWY